MESNELKKKNIQTSREEIDYGRPRALLYVEGFA